MNTTTTTTTATIDINDACRVNESLVRTAQDKLAKSAGKDSLDDLINARTRRSLLLCDTSSSMTMRIRTGETARRSGRSSTTFSKRIPSRSPRSVDVPSD